MDVGLDIAAAGMRAEQVRQDLLANDLANASTPGYRRDRVTQSSFGAMLVKSQGKEVGTLTAGVEISRTTTDVTPAGLRQTGDPLDFAVSGDGFFAVSTPQGARYTRNGQFQLSAKGTLTDQLGNEVVGTDGKAVKPGADGKIDPKSLRVVGLTNVRKEGDNLFTGTTGAATGTVEGGALEGSNVDPVRAMVDMIASLRSFESGQKAIQTIDATLQKAATQVGAVV